MLPHVAQIACPRQPPIELADRLGECFVASQLCDELASLTQPPQCKQQEGHIDLLANALVLKERVILLGVLFDTPTLHSDGADRIVGGAARQLELMALPLR